MFVSFICKKFVGYKNNKRIFLYDLTDSEFGTISDINVKVKVGNDAFVIGAPMAIIQEYSKRNLNVAANLAIALNWCIKKYPYHSVQDLINVNKKYNQLFSQYEKDLQKYLVLL
jgi:hypothetical protein